MKVERDLSQVLGEFQQEVTELRAITDVLKGALAAQGMEPIALVNWAKPLTPQQRAMVGALIRVHPHAMHRYDLLECLPSHDHARERSAELVTVLVSRIRQILGQDVIETVAHGYRVSDRFKAEVTPTDC